MRRKEGRGGRRDEESEKMKKLLKKWKMKKSLMDASLASLGLVLFLFSLHRLRSGLFDFVFPPRSS